MTTSASVFRSVSWQHSG